MRPYVSLIISIVVLGALLCWGGCGGQDLVVGGMLPATATPELTPTATCVEVGGICTFNTDCCSGSCVFSADGTFAQCV